jgi:acetylglutamate kinase
MKKRILLKLSGKSIDSLYSDPNWKDVFKQLKDNETEVVIVHGAGQQIDEFLSKQHIESRYINGKRVTDLETLQATIAVQNGIVNSLISKKLTEFSVPNVSLSSFTNEMFVVEEREENYGYVGIPRLSKDLDCLVKLLKSGFTPIISSLCIDQESHFINVNADEFASVLIQEMYFDAVYLLSDINAIQYKNNPLSEIYAEDIDDLLFSGEIKNGMFIKLKSCKEMIKNCEKIWIGNTSAKDLKLAMLGNSVGTWIKKIKAIEHESVSC